MKKLAWIATARTVAALTVVVGLALLGEERASAQGVVNFDVDPVTSCNGPASLGPVEDCVQLNGYFARDGVSDYNIDIVVFGDTQAPTAYDADLVMDNYAHVDVAAPGTNTAIKLPGSTDLSDALPNTDATYHASRVYLSGGPGTAGNGTIARVGLDLDGFGPYIIHFMLTPDPLTAYASAAAIHPTTVHGARVAVNMNCPVTSPSDSDFDGVFDLSDNCLCTPNADQTNTDGDSEGDACDLDDDDDGFLDTVEDYLATDTLDACPDSPADDAWPLDINRDTYVTVAADVLNYAGRIGATGGPPPGSNWMQRLDLNADNFLTVAGDVLMYSGKVGSHCT